MVEYIKQDFGQKGSRMNRKYEPPHYEADRLHICKAKNSYPDIEESAEEGE